MATTLTLKGIPDDLYARLKETAQVHRRSLNNEAIFVLEAALLPRKIDVEEHLASARALRASLGTQAFDAQAIDEAKRHGRA